jgi:hypothetical protein
MSDAVPNYYETMPADSKDVFGWKSGMGYVSTDLLLERLGEITKLHPQSPEWYVVADNAYRWLTDARKIRTELLVRSKNGTLIDNDLKIIQERLASDFFGNVMGIEELKNSQTAGETAQLVWADFKGTETKRYGADSGLLRRHLKAIFNIFESYKTGESRDFGFAKNLAKVVYDNTDPKFNQKQLVLLSFMSMGLVFEFPLAMIMADLYSQKGIINLEESTLKETASKQLKLDFLRKNVLISAPSKEKGVYAFINDKKIDWSSDVSFFLIDDLIETGGTPRDVLLELSKRYKGNPTKFNDAMTRTQIFSGINPIPQIESEASFVWERVYPSEISSRMKKTRIEITKK